MTEVTDDELGRVGTDAWRQELNTACHPRERVSCIPAHEVGASVLCLRAAQAEVPRLELEGLRLLIDQQQAVAAPQVGKALARDVLLANRRGRQRLSLSLLAL